MAAISMGEDLEAGTKLVAKAVKDFECVVGGTVVEAEERKVFGPVFDFLEPFMHDFAHRGLFVEDRQDDGEVGRHGFQERQA